MPIYTVGVSQDTAPTATPETLRAMRSGSPTLPTAGLYATPERQMQTLRTLGIAGRGHLLDPGTVAGGTAEAMRRLQQAPVGSQEAQQALSTIQWGASVGRRLLEQGQPVTTPPSEWASLMETAPAAAQIAAQYQDVLRRAQALTTTEQAPVEYVTGPSAWERAKPYIPYLVIGGGILTVAGIYYWKHYKE